VPDIPEQYRGKLGRQLVEASWNPYKLLKRGTRVTWIACAVLLSTLLVIILMIVLVRRVIRRYNRG